MTGAIIFSYSSQPIWETIQDMAFPLDGRGDWYLECGSSGHPNCREPQVRLVLSLRAVLLALILGSLGIGTNHFISYLQHHHSVNAIGALENYLLVLGWIVGWWIEVPRIKRNKVNIV